MASACTGKSQSSYLNQNIPTLRFISIGELIIESKSRINARFEDDIFRGSQLSSGQACICRFSFAELQADAFGKKVHRKPFMQMQRLGDPPMVLSQNRLLWWMQKSSPFIFLLRNVKPSAGTREKNQWKLFLVKNSNVHWMGGNSLGKMS